MEQKIIEILLKHSEMLKYKTGVLKITESEEWLWSGKFNEVAKEIIQLLKKWK